MKNLTLSGLACLSLLATASVFAASEPASRFENHALPKRSRK